MCHILPCRLVSTGTDAAWRRNRMEWNRPRRMECSLSLSSCFCFSPACWYHPRRQGGSGEEREKEGRRLYE